MIILIYFLKLFLTRKISLQTYPHVKILKKNSSKQNSTVLQGNNIA